MEVKRGSFSPLVFSSSGEMGPTAAVIYKCIATLISEKRVIPTVMCCIGLDVNSLFHSAVTCLHGSRSSYHRHNLSDPSIDLSYSKIDLNLNECLLNNMFYCY